MHWDDVRVFLAVARLGSLALGAKAAGLDRSTASRRITALETDLAARLFLRTPDGLRLSPAGTRLLPQAERMAQAATALTVAATESGQAVTGLVRIATTEALAVFLVREGLMDLRVQHPGLEIELLGGNRAVDLARGEADLAIRATATREPGLVTRRVARLAFALFASPAYVRLRGRPSSAEDLATHDVLVPGGELASLPEARWLASRPGVRVVFRSSSVPALVAAAAAGAGIAVVTDPWGQREPGLERLHPVEAIPPRGLWLVTHPDAVARTAVRVVFDAMVRTVGLAAQ